ncbi:hypothetical protein ACA910_020592 [Epithemia clementina (nom. ined.)]
MQRLEDISNKATIWHQAPYRWIFTWTYPTRRQIPALGRVIDNEPGLEDTCCDAAFSFTPGTLGSAQAAFSSGAKGDARLRRQEAVLAKATGVDKEASFVSFYTLDSIMGSQPELYSNFNKTGFWIVRKFRSGNL